MPQERPSGRQVELRHGAQRAVVVEVGGGLRKYNVDGLHVLDGYAADRMADGGRGQPLLPWPNRLADGQYEWDGRRLQLPVDELGRRNASHGLTRWLNWTVAEQSEERVLMRLILHPRPGYPFTLSLGIEYVLSETGLRVRTSACNAGSTPLPYGVGFHPYVSVGTELIDHSLLQIVAASVVDVDERMLPTGRLLTVHASELDFRRPRRIGGQRLDVCFADLERDSDGLAGALLCAPDGGPAVTLWMDSAFRYVQVFTGDTLASDRQRRGIAIEPMTCPPNAFGTSTDVIRLDPGQCHESTWGLWTSTLTRF